MDRYVVGEWLARIQFVSAMLVFGWLVLDISLPSSRYQASLGVSQSGTFMGGVVDLLDDGLQVRVREVVEAGPLGQVAGMRPLRFSFDPRWWEEYGSAR